MSAPFSHPGVSAPSSHPGVSVRALSRPVWALSRPALVLALVALAGSAAVAGVWLFASPGGPPAGGLPSGGLPVGANEAGTLDSCTEIDEPGEYELAEDVDGEAGTCIEITSDDVVFDGGDHRIDGTGAFGSAGIVVRADGDRTISNVTVRNVTVTGWDDAVRYVDAEGGAVVGIKVADSRVGLSLLNAGEIRIVNNTARENRLRGISLMEASANNTLARNEASDNDLFGIHLVEGGATNNTLVDNRATENEFGIVLVGAHGNEIRASETRDNRIAGIWLSGADDNLVTDNTVSDRFYGIFLENLASGNEVRNNTAEDTEVGIRLRSADGNAITENTIDGSGDHAILLISSDDNRVLDNHGTDNERGVGIIRSSGNEVRNNTVD